MTGATRPLTRAVPLHERVIEKLLFAAAAVGVLTTIGIIAILAFEAFEFFLLVSPVDFFTGTEWSALIQPLRWGVWPLVVSTLMIAVIALVIGIPLGLLSAVFLAEYASVRARNAVKPMLETIAGIPTIVLGFFAIYFLAPNILRPLVPGLGTFSALSAGIVVGILVTPLIASLSDDAMRAVPRSLREGAYAMGATRFEVIRKVVLPAALSGIMASIILAMSRAVGETMAVVLAAGTAPALTFDPRDSVQTMTAYIVQVSLGDTPAASVQNKSLFAIGATLFVITLALNLLSNWFVAKFRNVYE